jgi:ADP-ribose pyrophosphatase YjhB (NUDIX family)
MHKVFINNKPLEFRDVYREAPKGDGKLLIVSDAENSIDDVISRLGEERINGIVYLSASPDRAWHSFADKYVVVEAAGGVVRNEKGELLTIFRKKHWDLPKGKLDYDETPEAAALREVKEECGIKQLELENFLLNTFHTYTEKSKFILKKTHWFTMTTTDKKLIPQAEEDIELAEWMDEEALRNRFYKNTYLSIREVLACYFHVSRV